LVWTLELGIAFLGSFQAAIFFLTGFIAPGLFFCCYLLLYSFFLFPLLWLLSDYGVVIFAVVAVVTNSY